MVRACLDEKRNAIDMASGVINSIGIVPHPRRHQPDIPLSYFDHDPFIEPEKFTPCIRKSCNIDSRFAPD